MSHILTVKAAVWHICKRLSEFFSQPKWKCLWFDCSRSEQCVTDVLCGRQGWTWLDLGYTRSRSPLCPALFYKSWPLLLFSTYQPALCDQQQNPQRPSQPNPGPGECILQLSLQNKTLSWGCLCVTVHRQKSGLIPRSPRVLNYEGLFPHCEPSLSSQLVRMFHRMAQCQMFPFSTLRQAASAQWDKTLRRTAAMKI